MNLLQVLNYLYGFAGFGLLCFIGLPLSLPLALAPRSLRNRLRPVARQTIWNIFRFIRWHCEKTGFASMRLIDHRQGESCPLWIANHLTMFDIVSLFGFVPGIQTLVNAKFAANPLLWPTIKVCDYIPLNVQRPAEGIIAFQRLDQALDEGQTVVLFPEGTRSADGRLGALKKGPFRLAAQKGLRPTFVFFTCNQPFLNRAAFFPRLKGPVILEAHLFASPLSGGTESAQRAAFLEAYRAFTASAKALTWNRQQEVTA